MRFVAALKALADENRLKILDMLLNSNLCVGALAARLGISKPAVSQHLRILRKAGLVMGEKRGYWTHYMVDRKAIAHVAEEIREIGETRRPFDTVCWRINETPPDHFETKEVTMCQSCCQKPEILKDMPQNCTPDQIRECHGDTKDHPCSREESASEDS